MKLLLKILLSTFLISQAANISFAGGDHIGNGGDGVVCRDDLQKITSIELLDFYEGRVLRKLTPKIDTKMTYQKNIETIFKYLSFYDTRVVDIIEPWYQKFLQEAQFVRDVELVDVPDSSHLFIPKNCRIEQLAIQVEPQFPGDRRYIINKDLWEAMDTVSQAGLIIHELLYRKVIEENKAVKNSIAVRYFTSLAAADKILSLSQSEYLLFLESELKIDTNSINKTNIVEVLKKGRWEAEESGAYTQKTIIEFEDDKIFVTQKCMLSETGIGKDLEVTVSVNIKITSEQVTFLENAKKSVTDSATGSYCTSFVQKGFTEYQLVGSRELIFGNLTLHNTKVLED